MMTGDDVLMMPASHRVEVFTGTSRRRRWSRELKTQIVEHSYATSVGDASSRYGVSRSQLFNWRRETRADQPGIEFARVEVEAADRSDGGLGPGVIEVTVGGGAVRLGPGADAGLAAAVIMALKARSR